jgi:hypothetical protein
LVLFPNGHDLDLASSSAGTFVDRAIREEGERLRKAFPWLDERRR